MQWAKGALAGVFVLACAQALAQTPDPVPAETVAPAAPAATIRIPAGTIVEVELIEALSSETSRQEQLFGLRLVAPIVVDGREVVPAGAPGGGEVIDAARSAFGGRPGRLIISGRYIEIGGQRVRIRGMQITAAGEHRANEALAVSMIPYAGIAGIFIHGGKVEIPAGARGTARLAADVDIPLEPAPAATPEGAEQTQSTQPGENQE